MRVAQPRDLLEERRRRLARPAAERALHRPAQVAQPRLQLDRRPARAPRAGASASLETTSRTPNSRWITPSCTSRARSMRSCSWRARPAGTSRGAPPRRARRSCRASTAGRAPRRRAAGAGGGRPGSRRSSGRRPTAAADERRAVEQVAEALGQLARDRLGVHLDHAVLDERLARDRRRLRR